MESVSIHLLVYDSSRNRYGTIRSWLHLGYVCGNLIVRGEECYITGTINGEVIDNLRIEKLADLKKLSEHFGIPF